MEQHLGITAIVDGDVTTQLGRFPVSVPSVERLLTDERLTVQLPVVPEIEISKKGVVLAQFLEDQAAPAFVSPPALKEKKKEKEAPLLPPAVTAAAEPGPHKLWKLAGQGGKLKYTDSNIYVGSGVSKEDTKRSGIPGIEVRDLPAGHLLCGQQGLFATKAFEAFSIVGEYCGVIVPKTAGGHYVASLEDKDFDESVGVNAEFCGNEMRFINHYSGIGECATVKMVTVYIASSPHLVIVCKRDIAVGEEFLLDYGESYTSIYFKPQEVRECPVVDWGELPGNYTSDEDDNKEEEAEL
jgi:hypothetical protein